MSHFANKTYWIIGASHGLGREIARCLDAAGARLVLSARSVGKLEELAAELTDAKVVALDVTDPSSVANAAKAAGRIDAIVYNAGAYDPMLATQWDTEKILQMVDVNLNGAIRVIGAVLPQFRESRGDITLVGSLAAYRGLPASVGYGASKAALLSLAETMRHDLAGSGIVVRVVNPGFIKTRLTDKNAFSMPQLMTPEAAASHVLRAMGRRRFRTDFPRPFSWAIKLLHMLPDLLVYRGK